MKRKFLFFTLILGLLVSFANNAFATEVSVKNTSRYRDIFVAVVVNEGNGWITEGWYAVDRSETLTLPYDAKNKIYLYAYTYDNAGTLIEWRGDPNNSADVTKSIVEDTFTLGDTQAAHGNNVRNAIFRAIELVNYDVYTYTFK